MVARLLARRNRHVHRYCSWTVRWKYRHKHARGPCTALLQSLPSSWAWGSVQSGCAAVRCLPSIGSSVPVHQAGGWPDG